MRKSIWRPLGPDDSFKSGQRCPRSGLWRDQRGNTCRFDEHSTFPPVPGRNGGECAYWKLVQVREATA